MANNKLPPFFKKAFLFIRFAALTIVLAMIFSVFSIFSVLSKGSRAVKNILGYKDKNLSLGDQSNFIDDVFADVPGRGGFRGGGGGGGGGGGVH